jgi:hypothetical protein
LLGQAESRLLQAARKVGPKVVLVLLQLRVEHGGPEVAELNLDVVFLGARGQGDAEPVGREREELVVQQVHELAALVRAAEVEFALNVAGLLIVKVLSSHDGGEAGAVALPCKMSAVRRFRNIGMSACVKSSGPSDVR